MYQFPYYYRDIIGRSYELPSKMRAMHNIWVKNLHEFKIVHVRRWKSSIDLVDIMGKQFMP
jgi:hypothetical protein